MSRKFKVLVRLNEDLEVVFSVHETACTLCINDIKNYFDSNFGAEIEPRVLEDSIKLESVKRTSDGGIVYPIAENENKKWFSQHILSIEEEKDVMTVGELIKQLQKLDPNMPVETQNRDGGGDYYGSTPLNDMGRSNDEWIQSCVENGKLVLS